MITITPGAAEQIRRAAAEASDGAILRVAARREADGSVEFGMGFDEWRSGDLRILCEGVAVVVASPSRELVDAVTIDYVEITPGDFRFIFVAKDKAGASGAAEP